MSAVDEVLAKCGCWCAADLAILASAQRALEHRAMAEAVEYTARLESVACAGAFAQGQWAEFAESWVDPDIAWRLVYPAEYPAT